MPAPPEPAESEAASPCHSRRLVTSRPPHLLPEVRLGRLRAGRRLQTDWKDLLIFIVVISLRTRDQGLKSAGIMNKETFAQRHTLKSAQHHLRLCEAFARNDFGGQAP